MDSESPKLRVPGRNYRNPDIGVIPVPAIERRLREEPRSLEVYDDSMPLVVEVWSPSTGEHDIDQKLREYQQRGDQAVWRLDWYGRTLIAWRRQPDGAYSETRYSGGTIQPGALPGVTIEIEGLFE